MSTTTLKSRRQFCVTLGAGAVAAIARPAVAQPAPISISYYGGIPQPITFLIATGQLQKAFGAGVEVKLINAAAGPQILTGMASGQIDLGQVGMPPMVTAFANGLDISMVYMGRIQDRNEALVVHSDSGIRKVSDLRDKKIGVPYNTETHFALLKALEKAGLRLSDANVINMPPGSVYAGFQRRDIDATYIWSPILDQLLAEGGVTVLASAKDLRDAGAPLFEGFIARNQFKQQRPETVAAYVREAERAQKLFRDDSRSVIEPLAKYTNLSVQVVQAYVDLYSTVPAAEILSTQWMGAPGAKDSGAARAVTEVAKFLVVTQQLKTPLENAQRFIDSSFAARLV